jgi:hypothetical protein
MAIYEIDTALINQFFKDWHAGKYPNQRLGQAFYNEFRLDRLTDQSDVGDLWNLDGVQASFYINQLFI